VSDLLILLTFIVVLLIPILIGVPIIYAIGVSSLVLMLLPFGPSLSASVFPTRMLGASTAFILLAIPAYLLTGYLLNESGATEAVLDFSRELVGPLTAGLAQINIVASVLFSGMSGSATADAAGLGNVEFEMMTEAGYDEDISVAITGSSSIIGPIIPPSIPMIIYGSLAGVSVADLFIAGVIPGLLMAVALMITSYVLIRGMTTPQAICGTPEP